MERCSAEGATHYVNYVSNELEKEKKMQDGRVIRESGARGASYEAELMEH